MEKQKEKKETKLKPTISSVDLSQIDEIKVMAAGCHCSA